MLEAYTMGGFENIGDKVYVQLLLWRGCIFDTTTFQNMLVLSCAGCYLSVGAFILIFQKGSSNFHGKIINALIMCFVGYVSF